MAVQAHFGSQTESRSPLIVLFDVVLKVLFVGLRRVDALQNYQNVSGTGFNMKFGLIFKPIQQLRFGLAIHTPTWYHLTNGLRKVRQGSDC